MQFKNGKCYKNDITGQSISIVAEIKAHRFGKMLVIEGSGSQSDMMVIEDVVPPKGVEINPDWHEISKDEWLTDFSNNHKCFECKKPIDIGGSYRMTNHGLVHEDCFKKITAEKDVKNVKKLA